MNEKKRFFPRSTGRLESRLYLPLLFCVLSSNAAWCEEDLAQEKVDFNRDIRPILSDNCFQCHGPDAASREADLRLDVEEDAKLDRGGYSVITPGKSAESEFVSRIRSADERELMPPPEIHKPLSPREIELLARWIDEGVDWSMAWAYVPPVRHAIPEVSHHEWPTNWIDRFILSRLEKEGLQPAGEADRVTLIRRLSFDLVGLPPTPEEVAQFVDDDRPDAYERLVDRLLASPHFGERMAIYWLDLVRYADTVGYHGDQTQNIWPYRDYVIHAFNTNKPFDEFTKEQLAGDLLDNSSIDTQIASGYNRLLQTTHEGGAQRKEYRAIYMADRVRNISQVWMGATVGCAQCHDHKFDPYTARDFYTLGAFFADLDDEIHLHTPAEDLSTLPTIRKPEIEVLSILQRERLVQCEDEIRKLEGSPEDAKVEQRKKEIETIKAAPGLTMIAKQCEPRVVRVLSRGDWMDDSGEVVGPAVPTFLSSIPLADGRRATRIDLANWLTDTDDGVGRLTARVMVNRWWALMFGRGIASVLDDFGGQGQPPVHPELLDQLAVEFLESGWDVKQMVRVIALSSTYRQSSIAPKELRDRDPYNELLARQSRFRVPAEVVRDTALRVSGLLQDEIGGPSVKPYQPAGHYRHLNFPAREYEHDTNEQQWRRGLYVHWQRQFLHPMLRAFDAPTREECTASRSRSNTALAALTLLNDPTFVEASRTFAERILAGAESQSERMEYAFRWATSRAPTEDEARVLKELLEKSRAYYESHPEEAKQAMTTGLRKVGDEVDQVDLAAWANVARAILNLGETTMRN